MFRVPNKGILAAGNFPAIGTWEYGVQAIIQIIIGPYRVIGCTDQCTVVGFGLNGTDSVLRTHSM